MNEYANSTRGVRSAMQEAAGCEGKTQYSTYAAAHEVSKRVASHSHNIIKPYKCRYCGQYHVGRPLAKGK